MNTVITVKLLKPEAVVLPNGYIVAPVLRPQSRIVPGWSAPVPVHEMDYEYTYQITLKDEDEAVLPPHILADADLKRAFVLQNATRQADNHAENNRVRICLEMEAEAGRIEVLHDSFLDRDTAIPKNPSDATMSTDKHGLAVQNELRQQRKRDARIRGEQIPTETPKPRPHARGVNLDGTEIAKPVEDTAPEAYESEEVMAPVKRGPGRPPKHIEG